MACPFFSPLVRLEFRNGGDPARAPLGAIYAGTCEAAPGESIVPDDATLIERCNFGYGRDSCPRFPQTSNIDAVRFTAKPDDGALTKALFIFERAYSPVAHGDAERTEDVLVRRQAQLFLENYRAWKFA